MKKYILLLNILPAVMLLFAGCSDRDADKKRSVAQLQLSSFPEGAVAHVAGKTFKLPHHFKMTPGQYLFRIEKPGYASAWFACRVRASGIFIPRTAADGSVVWDKLPSASRQVTLREHGGTVLIESDPDTANVIKDGRTIGVTPLVLTDLPAGTHEVQLQSPNFATISVPWEIKNSRPIVLRTDLQSNIGQVEITSDPAGARLLIDGKAVGVTPFRGTHIVGNYEVLLQRDGYLPYKGHISVRKDTVSKESYTLTVSPCNLGIVSSPSGAQVYLNDKPYGTTPLALKDLPAGTYRIVLSLDGHDPAGETVELAPGSSLKKEFNLGSSKGGIELNIYPAGVQVFLNGRSIGTVKPGEGKTQTQLLRIPNLAPGVYIVKAVHKRAAEPEVRRIVVQKGTVVRPERIDLWVPNAEIVWKDNGRTELGIIYGETEKSISFGPVKGIRYDVRKDLLKSIKFLDINE